MRLLRSNRIRLGVVAGALVALGVGSTAVADPCGMVPPVTMIEGDPIVRVGAQRTYVAHYKGVETIALRPGFEGKVDEFGMLIPFPAVPEIRKLDDNIFPHLAAAIDPPEVQAWVQRWRGRGGGLRSTSKSAAPSAAESADDSGGGGLQYDEVRVMKQEAVGMYEVAVLAAGSAKALKKWMDKHKFQYPDGMDKVVNEYVDDRWVFVAVKTKVGQQKGVNPRPGMKKADSKLPEGAKFSGHVQAMGFRFKSKELVVPMRLSAFNKGKLHNIVYILTDDPQHIKKIPKRFVRRQISGKQLYDNLTGPLPLRVMNGTYADLSPSQKQNLPAQRNPEPHNGLAKQMIAADLLAITTGELSSKVEEKEKQLLAIDERLSLRGPEIDALRAQVLKKENDRAVTKALKHVKKLTLTVVDGEFERDTLAEDNLYFADYKVPKKRNTPDSYDARHQGPRPARGGKLYRGKVGSLDEQHQQPSNGMPGWFLGMGGTGFGLLLLFGGLFIVRRPRSRKLGRYTLLGALVAFALTAASPAFAAGDIDDLIAQLGDKDKAQAAIDALTRKGEAAVDPLLDTIVDSDNDVVKGWAIVALSQIGGDAVDKELEKIQNSTGYKMLIRTWAAAARIDMAQDLDRLMELAPLANSYPALQRPLRLALTAKIGTKGGWRGAEEMLKAVTKVPSLAQSLNPAIIAVGPKPLVQTMVRSSDMQVRQMAAAYLPSVKGDVSGTVIKAYSFRKKAKQVPWHGGPLYVPGIAWSKEDATALVDELVKWHLWADLHDDAEVKKQIHNNLQAWQLVNGAGYQNPGWQEVSTERWLQIWGKVRGRRHIRKILKEQGVRWDKKWRQVLIDIDD